MDETEYLSRINLADHEVLAERRRGARAGEVQLDEASAWPDDVADLLRTSDAAELLRIQYITERYYARQIKSSPDELRQDELLALAYLRVIYLQFLRCEPDMGFTKRELDFVLAAIKRFQERKEREPVLLEVGCGAGSLLESLAEAGFRSISGVDLAPAAIELARRRLAPYGLAEKVRRTTTNGLLSLGHAKTFDMVLLCDVIEHIPPGRVQSLLAEVRELLRDEGMLIVSTPNASTGPHDITRHFQPRGSAPEGLHLREYSLQDLVNLLDRAGFGRFMGLSLLNCTRWPGKLRLSMFSMNIRLAIERLFPYVPSTLTRRVVDRLYFCALCSWSSC
jgi:2-polyprenyl-3-methyl-5-hydroxy-6-metoxy-1,4-benzoquinol methylase